MSTVQPTDKVLVNRAGTDYSATADTLMATIQDTDLLLVNRAGVDYKCSGLDFKASMVPPETVDKPSLTSPSDGATDVGKNPTFTSSAFSGQNGATHVSTDWQVTTKADTGFTAIVTQSMADTTNKVSWKSGDLAANTDYIARVRYHSAGAVSAWSDVVGFKAKASFILQADPGYLYRVLANGTAQKVTTPVKLINVATANDSLVAVGVDGQLYGANSVASVASLPALSGLSHAPYAAVALGYNYGVTTTAASLTLNMAGEVYKGYTQLGPAGGEKIFSFGCVTDLLACVTASGELWAASNAPNMRVADFVCTTAGWHKVPVHSVPGAKLVSVCGGGGGDYDAPNVMLLYSDGSLWSASAPGNTEQVGGIGSTGTLLNPHRVFPGTSFSAINTAGGNYQGHGAISAVDSAGQLYYGATANASLTGAAIAFSQLAGETGWREPLYSGYKNSNGKVAIGLKDDGQIYYAVDNFAFKPVNFGFNYTCNSVGAIRMAMNVAGTSLFVILP